MLRCSYKSKVVMHKLLWDKTIRIIPNYLIKDTNAIEERSLDMREKDNIWWVLEVGVEEMEGTTSTKGEDWVRTVSDGIKGSL